MSTLRKLKAYIVGGVGADHGSELKAADIPVSDADCRGCANPCDEGSMWTWKQKCSVP